MIERTRGQLETHSRGRALCKEVRAVTALLEGVRRESAQEEENFPDTEEAVQG